ncbi:MAG: hypothetical protein NC343_08810, partial [Muribaculum sp.]|nr:hypothetical protein [Muribaculum sp.]
GQSVSPGYSPLGYNTLEEGTVILIGDRQNIRDTDYYKATAWGKAFYIAAKDVRLLPEYAAALDSLTALPQTQRDVHFQTTKYFSKGLENMRLEGLLSKLKAYENRGIMVTEARPYDESEYTDGTGMDFSICNTSNKTIKYITFNFIGYNAVNDPVSSYGKTLISRRGIGPIAPGEQASYSFEYVWFTDIVDHSRLRSIVVQYTNGTSRTFTGKAVEIIPADLLQQFENPDPLPSFK